MLKRLQNIERETLIEILKLAGLDEGDMDWFHAKLEEMSSEWHQIFLEALGIDKEEIKEIREYARSINSEKCGLEYSFVHGGKALEEVL